ncbi:MAG: hypothetical protein RJA07_1290 [Bacteroidota bacterium]|jgi:iron complex outermembrane receptor protein
MNRILITILLMVLYLLPFNTYSQTAIESSKATLNGMPMMMLCPVNIIDIATSIISTTSNNAVVLSKENIANSGAISLSDAVAKLPGISQLTTGAGISKPVIRGLYGNRVQINVMSLRFDNQQWQDEHGMGLTDMGVNTLEIIKGPASLTYGSDALGGVINITDESWAAMNHKEQEIKTKLLSNTLGVGLEYGIKKTTENKSWKLRIGAENNADYSSANNTRVLNSRFDNYSIKASENKYRRGWEMNTNFYAGVNRFGFVFDSLSRKTIDNRISRTYDGPHHRVFFGLLSSINTKQINEKNTAIIKAGIISNLRQEQEGGNRISLNMLLNTYSLSAQINRRMQSHANLIYGVSSFYQTNKNLGSRIIVPDAHTLESSAFAVFKKYFSNYQNYVEAGLRYDVRSITTLFSDSILNNGMPAFTKTKGSLNGSVATNIWAIKKIILVQANVGSGYRSGNLAELSSNGLHEGTSRWEVGNPDLKIEQNINSEIGLRIFTINKYVKQNNKLNLDFSINAFHNQFYNYIYLAPTPHQYYGFTIYNYVQSNATLQGSEIIMNAMLNNITHQQQLFFKSEFSYLQAKKADGTYLPFIPASKFYNEIKLTSHVNQFVLLGITNVLAQNKPAVFETATPAYYTINAAIGKEWKKDGSQKIYSLSITGTNLTDTKYFDHLSRFKYYGIYNIGRNIMVNFSIKF